ncbi:MAG: TRAP transporter permease [Ectothiorhodospiraceae bacterium]|nr:TRAP transporter permease [Ectothiorhodospiraceae bacterium]
MPRRILFLTAVAWSLFQLWIASPLPFELGWFVVPETHARAIHLAFAVFLAFTAFPAALHRPGFMPRLAPWLLGSAAMASVLAAAGFHADDRVAAAVAALAVAFCLTIAARSAMRPDLTGRIPAADWLLALLAAASALYLYLFSDALATRPGLPTLPDLVMAGIGMALLLEATRRTLGPALAIIALLFLGYVFAGPWMPDLLAHRGASLERTLSQQWLGAEGVFGVALGVSTSFVFLFVLFGALLDRAGAGNWFIQSAFALLGRFRGGPAKAAVVASGLTGVISGSSIANTVTTGTFTIPLMKRVGFTPEKAGAIEVAASVNGQIMPPVMGAAAFLMAEYTAVPYVEVIKHAFLPAVIAYLALLYIVHLEALKADMRGIAPERPTCIARALLAIALTVSGFAVLAGIVHFGVGWTRQVFGAYASWGMAALVLLGYLGVLAWSAGRRLPEPEAPDAPVLHLPPVADTLRSGLYFLLPVVVLVWCLMVERLSPGLSAFWATLYLMFILVTQRPLLALLRREGGGVRALREGLNDLVQGLATGARNMVAIGVATAAAGIVVGTVSMTGLGLVMTELVEHLAGGNLMLMLLLVAVISLVLGMGLPTTANYIIVATLMAPVVVEVGVQNGLLLPLIAAHLFVFYFGLMADVTPPVGLASFAAAAISRGDPLQTGVQAFLYSLRTAVLPFFFLFNTQLLLIDVTSFGHGLLVAGSALAAMLCFAAATQGWFLTRSRWWETAALLLVTFTLFRPGFWMDRIVDPYTERPVTELYQIAEGMPRNAHIRLAAEGPTLTGETTQRVMMLPLGAPANGQRRLMNAGLTLMPQGDAMNVLGVSFGSPAERAGIGFGWRVTGVLVTAERPSPAWLYLPALGLLGLVVLAQYRRRRR